MFEHPFALAPTPAHRAALDLPFHSIFEFLHLDWPGGEVLFWTGLGEIVMGGRTFHGTGVLGALEYPEGADADAVQTLIGRLSGLPESYLAHDARTDLTGRRAAAGLSMVGLDGEIIDPPYVTFNGQIDGRRINPSRGEDGVTLIDILLSLSTGERPASRVSQRHVPQDATETDTGWTKMSVLKDPAPQWPEVA